MTVAACPGSLAELLAARRTGTGRYVCQPAGRGPEVLSFGELARTAADGALALRGIDARRSLKGMVVVLALADPLAFIRAFFIVAWAGAIPVPGPARLATNPPHARRLRTIVEVSSARLLITTAADRADVADIVAGHPTQILPVEEIGSAPAGRPSPPARHPIAYIQYTSGSITDPTPVVIRQRQVFAQLRQAAAAFAESTASVSANWVPLFHDMGLVTSVLRPLWSDYTSVILDPADFVYDPACWPAAMSRWRATHTSAPDFGYALCAMKVGDTSVFDLSSLRVARNAGELVQSQTLRRFANTFRPAGFNPVAATPSYGLSEATLTVSTCPPGSLPRELRVSRSALGDGRVRAPTSPADRRTLIGCGRPLDGTSVGVFDPRGRPLEDGAVGELVVHGPQVTVDNDAADAIGTCRTGDVGFRWRGEIVPIGRGRERFQVRGQNFYATEIETHVYSHEPRLRPGRVAVFAATPRFAGGLGQGVIVVAEVRAGPPDPDSREHADLSRSIRRLLSTDFGLATNQTVFVAPRTLPLTTSGKIRREECRTMVETRQIPDDAA